MASMLILRMAVLMLCLESTVAGKPIMQIITTSSDVELGGRFFLLCKAGGEGDITWQKDGDDLSDGVEKLDETSSKLTIESATLEDAGSYACICDFDAAAQDSVSYMIYVYEPVRFGETALHHEFLEGTDAVVPCVVTGKPEVVVQWFRQGDVVRRDGGRVKVLDDFSLQVKGIRRTDAGLYVCQGSIKGRNIVEQLNITVDVNVHPTVRITEQVKHVMSGHDSISLTCLVDGIPKPDITWITPGVWDESRYQLSADRSVLSLSTLARADHGEYVCTARNKIGENTTTMTLHVSVPPQVFLSGEKEEVRPGESVSVSCNASGHPTPSLLWVSNTGHHLNSSEGRVRVEQGSLLVVEQVVPSDGGVYHCMAVSSSGNDSRDFSLQTHPGPPSQVSASSGPTSVAFSLKGAQIDGGSPITQYVLQWRRSDQDPWSEATVGAKEQLVITSLKPYLAYSVRLAPKNHLGQGGFSTPNTVRTQGIQGEPDCPELSTSKVKMEGSNFSLPFRQLEDGGVPITHYILRYRSVKEGGAWTEKKLPPTSSVLHLQDLQYNTSYHLELLAVNPNGTSTPAKHAFITPQPPPVKAKMGKGAVVAIVMFIFLVLLLAVDATCCYTNQCGLLMFLAVRLFGHKVPGMKTVEDGDNITNGDLKLNGQEAPRGSVSKQQSVNGAQGGAEVTCDKVPLTKADKITSNGDPATNA